MNVKSFSCIPNWIELWTTQPYLHSSLVHGTVQKADFDWDSFGPFCDFLGGFGGFAGGLLGAVILAVLLGYLHTETHKHPLTDLT